MIDRRAPHAPARFGALVATAALSIACSSSPAVEAASATGADGGASSSSTTGAPLWVLPLHPQTHGGEAFDVAGPIFAADAEGNVYLAGVSLDDHQDPLVDLAGPVRCEPFEQDREHAFVVKIDPSGARVWVHCLAAWGLGASGGLTTFAAAPSGGVLVVGVVGGAADVEGVSVAPPDGNGETFLIGLDASGGTRFLTTWTPASSVLLAARDDGGAAAVVQSALGPLDLGVPVEGSGATTLVSFDPTGAAASARALDLPQTPSSIAVAPSGDIALANVRFAADVSPAGALRWTRAWSSAASENSQTSLAFTAAGDLAVAGGVGEAVDFGDGPTSPLVGYTVGLRADGAFSWQETLAQVGATSSNVSANGVAASADGRILAALDVPARFVSFHGARTPCDDCGVLLEVASGGASATIAALHASVDAGLAGVAFGPHERIVLGAFRGDDVTIGGVAVPIANDPQSITPALFLAALPDD